MLRLSARVAGGVVVAKRGFEIHGVFESDQLPADFVLIAAVLRAGKHPDDRVIADRREEGAFLDSCERLYLLRRGQLRELAGTREKLLRLCLEVFDPLRKAADYRGEKWSARYR